MGHILIIMSLHLPAHHFQAEQRNPSFAKKIVKNKVKGYIWNPRDSAGASYIEHFKGPNMGSFYVFSFV